MSSISHSDDSTLHHSSLQTRTCTTPSVIQVQYKCAQPFTLPFGQATGLDFDVYFFKKKKEKEKAWAFSRDIVFRQGTGDISWLAKMVTNDQKDLLIGLHLLELISVSQSQDYLLRVLTKCRHPRPGCLAASSADSSEELHQLALEPVYTCQ